MSTSAVSPVSSASYSTATERIPIQTLGQNDFLKLLITQMTSQDPMNPQKDTEFIAQMAQFSALEQSKTMQADMSDMKSMQQLLQAGSLIGSTVTLQLDSATTGTGVVQAVNVLDSTPRLVVGGQEYAMSQVLTIAPTILDDTAPASTEARP